MADTTERRLVNAWRKNSLFATLCLAAGGAASVWMGQDGNWDLLNYHLYNAFQLVEGRRDIDFAAAGFQSFLSPLADVPYYLLAVKWLPTFPRVVAAIQGLYFGALIYVVLKINERIFSRSMPSPFPQALIATVIGVTGAAILSEVGTTFGDIQVALSVLSGVLVLMPLCASNPPPSPTTPPLVAGLLFGTAAGVKLTAVTFAPAAICALLACVVPARRSVAVVGIFAAGWMVAFGITYGWWGWLLWDMTGSPMFPFFNAIFRSDWYPPTNFSDPFFKIDSWVTGLVYPFYWAERQAGLITEIPFRDARFAAAYVAFFVLAALALCARLSPRSTTFDRDLAQDRSARFIVVFAVLSYATWLLKFVALRYTTVIEALTGTLIVLALQRVAGLVFSERRRAAVVAATSGLLVLGALLIHTEPPQWARREFSSRVFSVKVPDMPPDSLLVIQNAPLAYVIPFITSARFAATSVTWVTIPGYRIYDETKRRIATHAGPAFVLYNRLEPATFRNLIADLGLVWDDGNCRPVDSNMSWGLLLCDAQRR